MANLKDDKDVIMTGASIIPEESINDAEKKRWTPGYVINHFSKFINLANEATAVDNILWDGFREYFEDWDVTNFKLAGTTDLNNLRIFLRQRGVYIVRRKGFSVAQALHNVLLENEPSEWPEDELTNQIQKGSFYSHRIPRAVAHTPVIDPHISTPPPGEPPSIHPLGIAINSPAMPPTEQNHASSCINNSPHSHHRNSHPSHHKNNFRSEMDQNISSSQQNLISPNVPQNRIHPNRVQDEFTERQRTTSLINLHKIYRDNMKYSGQCDNLDCALDDFHEMCSIAGVPDTYKCQAFHIMLKDSAKLFYSENIRDKIFNFDEMVQTLRNNFETPELQREMQSSFNSLTLSKILTIHKGLKTKSECLEELVREIQRLYRGLPRYNRTSESKDLELRSKLLAACEEDPDCSMACMLPAKTFQALIAQLRTSISLSLKVQKSQTTTHYTVNGYENESFYTDRQYHGQKRPQTPSSSANNKEKPKTNSGKKACFVCSKEGCWSTRHSPEERIKSMADFKSKTLRLTGRKYTGSEIRQFLSDFEGLELAQEIPDNFSHFHVTQDDEESDDLEDFFRTGNFFSDSQTETTSEVYSDFFPTLRGDIDGYTAVVSLRDKSIEHLLTQSRPCLGSRYSSLKFEGILIDTGAAKVSTAGYNQFLALKRLRPTLKIDNSRAGEARIIFGIGSTSSLGTTDVDTPVGTITFHITNSVTPFLFCLADMDNMKVHYNNLTDLLTQHSITDLVLITY